MSRFSIVSSQSGQSVADFDAHDGDNILNVIQRSGCRCADVYRDGQYLLSARLDESEVWSLYRSDEAERTVAR